MKRARLLGFVALLGVALAAGRCRIAKEGDPMLDFDVFEPRTWDAAEIVPGAPWIRAGRDGELGTDDDRYEPAVRGDVDLVLRTGRSALGAAVPPPASAGPVASWPAGVAEPFGAGTPIAYVVAPVDAWSGAAPGTLTSTPYWSGLPLLVLAFADLDGDGSVGVTHLDGDVADAALEEAEWEPVGRHFAFGASGQASGALQIGVGGPSAHPARVVLGAATWAGEPEPGFLGGNVPRGPAVMTRLPFLPEMAPRRVLEGGEQGPPPAAPGALVGVEVRPAVAPDPSDPRIGEAFTLRLDGSDATTDVALVASGAPSRFGLVQQPDPATFQSLPQRPLRPGLAPGGAPRGVEVLQRLRVADDGAASAATVRVVALDALGNVTEPGAVTTVTLHAVGPLRIASPDVDGDPLVETVTVTDAIGAAVEIDDEGDALDGPDTGEIRVAWSAGAARIAALSPDPDVDDDGDVDADDADAVRALRGERLGDAGFEARFDLDASGRIDDGDEEIAERAEGATPAIP